MNAVLTVCIALSVAAFAGQLFGWARSRSSWLQHILRLATLTIWGATTLWLLVTFIFFHYCEHNCGDELNPLALFVVAAIVAVDAGSVWLALRGIAKLGRRDA